MGMRVPAADLAGVNAIAEALGPDVQVGAGFSLGGGLGAPCRRCLVCGCFGMSLVGAVTCRTAARCCA